MTKQNSRTLGRFGPVALLIVAMWLWGSAFVAMKQALATASVADVMFYRLALASVAMLPFVVVRRQRWPVGRDLMMLVGLGLLEPVLYFTFESLALQYTTAAQGGLVFALLPLCIIGLNALFSRGWPGLGVWIAGLLGALAVVIVTLGRPSAAAYGSPSPALGNSLELLAILSAAAYTVLADHLLRRYSPAQLTFLQCVFGACCFGGYWLVSDGTAIHAEPALGYVLYLGLIVTGGAYFAFNNAIKHLSAQVVAPFYSLVPIFTMLSTVAWDGRGLSEGLVFGIALSFLAIISATRASANY